MSQSQPWIMPGGVPRQRSSAPRVPAIVLTSILLVVVLSSGCKSPEQHRRDADQAAAKMLAAKQTDALGRTEPLDIEAPSDTLRKRLLLGQKLPTVAPASLGPYDVPRIKQWPDAEFLDPARSPKAGPVTEASPTIQAMSLAPQGTPLVLTLFDALQLGARSSRDYQTQKEEVFRTALQLDAALDEFRNSWGGVVESLLIADLAPDDDRLSIENAASLSLSRKFYNGARFSSRLGLDLAKLLTTGGDSSLGLFGDASVSIPLLRGSGRFVVTEPLTQAERNVVYAIYDFERFKRVFAVRIASDYLSVLQQLDQVINAEENYRRLIASSRRALRLSGAGRLPEIQVDQARQDELRARDRWISAQQSYYRALDQFKVLLGLPADAFVELDRQEIHKLADMAKRTIGDIPPIEAIGEAHSADAPVVLPPMSDEGRGPFELPEPVAQRVALDNRLDLRATLGRVEDTQRGVAVAADNLRADLTLLGSTSVGERRSTGSATQPDANFRFEEGNYRAGLNLDLPLERTSERNLYRNSLINFQRAVRNLQQAEDQVKLDVRNNLRQLLQSRESLRIQALAVQLAQRRVVSSNLFLQAGRAQIRDLLEAENALVQAQNAYTAALVNYRVSELQLQRDMGVLQVDADGLWHEYVPPGPVAP